MDNNIENFEVSLEKTLSERVRASQERTISKIKVYNSTSEIIGSELDKSIEEAFRKPDNKNNYSPRVAKAISHLQEGLEEMSETRMIELPGWTPLLVRKTWISPRVLTRTEIFVDPDSYIETSGLTTKLLCGFYLMTDLKSNKTANLTDVLTNSKNYIQKTFLGNSKGGSHTEVSETYTDPKTGRFMIFDKSGAKVNATTFVWLHEAGHLYQNALYNLTVPSRSENGLLGSITSSLVSILSKIEPRLNFKETNILKVVQERNASAFALAVIRRYRQLGVDLCPNLTNKQLITIINWALSTRSEDPRINFKFTKTRSGKYLD